MKQIHFKLREGEEFITLIQLLKAASVAETGALAQILVTQDKVKRNNVTEYRKRAKIVRGEEIETLGVEIITE